MGVYQANGVTLWCGFITRDKLQDAEFSLGVPDGKLGQLQDYHYGVARLLDRYTEATTGHGSELDETAFTHYTVESGQYFALGDKVLFQEKELTVAASTARFTEGGL
ncbi:hypothetical protein, partial [Brevibacillus laterosporus]|nr:hypothetical protein [Brevibacillus laterosporus]MED1668520.1 hypothetical protein [Brevibacillus laterosporus]MED1719212.1 hypothetical protein [Brevibacillus laterosporus]